MSPEAQRIAIAEACGLKHVRWDDGELVHGTACRIRVPDYLNDLNAMHEAVLAQDMEFNGAFSCALYNLAGTDGRNCFTHQLTAKDWADCFIEVMRSTAPRVAASDGGGKGEKGKQQ
jgi:hypothetical protein